jgi:hypothetical protein
MNINPILRAIVDRLHVSESNRDVIRYVISRLQDGYVTYRAMPRWKRREFLAQCLEAHRQNRELYSAVMRGR